MNDTFYYQNEKRDYASIDINILFIYCRCFNILLLLWALNYTVIAKWLFSLYITLTTGVVAASRNLRRRVLVHY